VVYHLELLLQLLDSVGWLTGRKVLKEVVQQMSAQKMLSISVTGNMVVNYFNYF